MASFGYCLLDGTLSRPSILSVEITLLDLHEAFACVLADDPDLVGIGTVQLGLDLSIWAGLLDEASGGVALLRATVSGRRVLDYELHAVAVYWPAGRLGARGTLSRKTFECVRGFEPSMSEIMVHGVAK